MHYPSLAIASIVCPFVIAASASAQARIPAGDEGELSIEGSEFPCRLFVPSDYEVGKRFPLIFFLHGSGGKPTSWPWKSATGGETYLICGLSYGALSGGGAGGISADKRSRRAMVVFIDKVRELIDKTYGVDQDRVFLTGLSMGGWGVNHYGFFDAARGRYRGYCIIAAGLARGGSLSLSVAEGLPLLLLNGEKDGNLAAANAGKPVFEKAGLEVTQVVLPGEGHVPSTKAMAPPLEKWLDGIAELDEKRRSLVAVQWQPGRLSGSTLDEAERATALDGFMRKQVFLKEAGYTKPVLVYCYSDRRGKKDKLTRAAADSERAESAIFSFPGACAVPAASLHFTCIRVNVSLVDKRTDPQLHEGLAPAVLLLDSNHALVQMIGKRKLRDGSLCVEMKKLLSSEQQTDIDARIAKTRPVLKQMQTLRRKRETMEKLITRLKKSSRRSAQKKLGIKLAMRAELDEEYDALRQQLVK